MESYASRSLGLVLLHPKSRSRGIRWLCRAMQRIPSRGLERWRSLILPGIFPYLITGLLTASGGAWNASIVAEYFHFNGRMISTVGLGATISRATDNGNFTLCWLPLVSWP